jgi:hypothetical protein
MIKWWDVPRNLAEVRDRYEALTVRDLYERTRTAPAVRGEDHGALSTEKYPPLSLEERAELLAYGAELARSYAPMGPRVDHAVRAGLTWEDIAGAIGAQSAAAARAAYREWAAGQRQLNATSEPGSTLGLTAERYAEALALASEPSAPVARAAAHAAAVRDLVAVGDDRRALDERARSVVLAGRAAGVSVRQCAELADVSADTVTRWTEARAVELLRDGVDESTVAAETGAQLATVRRWAEKAQR